MAYEMQSDGNWVHKEGGGGGGGSGGGAAGSNGTSVDNGTVDENSTALSEITANKQEKLEYVETATARVYGMPNLRRGNWLKIKKGVADRWLGKWLILACTHTIDSKGYCVDLELGRKPKPAGGGGGGGGGGSATDSSTPASDKTATVDNNNSNTDSADKVWKLNSSGEWVQEEK